MADLRKQYGINISKATDGTWTEDLGDGLKLKIARLKNPNFQREYNRLTQPYQRQIRTGKLDPKIEEKIATECLAEAVLLDWENLELDNKKLPYSKENALKVLSDPTLSDFRDFIVELATNFELFREEELEEAEKN